MSALIPLVCFFFLLFLRLGWDLPHRCGKGNSPSVSLQLRQSFAVPASSSPAWHNRSGGALAMQQGLILSILPVGSPSSQLYIRSATRANLLPMSSSVSRTTPSTCKWALPAKAPILLRRAESSCPHQLAAATTLRGVQISWEPLQSAGRADVPLLSPGDCQPEPGICTEVPADLPLSSKGSFSFCFCLGSALSGAEHLPPFTFFRCDGFRSQRDSAKSS